MRGAEDLERLAVLDGTEDGFGRQLEVLEKLAEHFRGRLLMTTTIFNAWTTLRQLLQPETGVHGPPNLGELTDPRQAILADLLRESPEAVAGAVEVIGKSLANFARHCLAAGADGIYLSVRDDWVDEPNGRGTYDRLAPAGRHGNSGRGQAGASTCSTFVAMCSISCFAAYPVHVINWADRSAGPSIAEVAGWVRPAICGGVDNLGTMVEAGSPDDCTRQVADALAQAGGRPIMISPGCTFDPAKVPGGEPPGDSPGGGVERNEFRSTLRNFPHGCVVY